MRRPSCLRRRHLTKGVLTSALGRAARSVAQRENELAIRLALGESTRAVFARVVGEGLVLYAVSCIIGIGVESLIRNLIYGTEPVHPAAIATILVLLAAVTFIACAIPALRAIRIAPAATLRSA
jgi:putative ABC transport system permease protein